MSRWKLGSMVRIGGLFHLLRNGVYWGYNPLILTFDPNFQRDIQVFDRLEKTDGFKHTPFSKRQGKEGFILNSKCFFSATEVIDVIVSSHEGGPSFYFCHHLHPLTLDIQS